jgi:hypothetical protein
LGPARYDIGVRHRDVLSSASKPESLGLSSLDLLTDGGRNSRIGSCRLGEVSFEQFQTAEPAGRTCFWVGLKVKVAFSRHLV